MRLLRREGFSQTVAGHGFSVIDEYDPASMPAELDRLQHFVEERCDGAVPEGMLSLKFFSRHRPPSWLYDDDAAPPSVYRHDPSVVGV